ncbi:MAG: hypothetical protein K2P51_06335 [Rhabdochlamydiaceae bacterium]|nr:hypothetical protein [Rhabdochlamydiaceae bacterium]
MTQAGVFIFLDLPIGYLLSKLGDYKSLFLSFIFGTTGVLIYLFYKTLSAFIIAEIFFALSLSIWPAAFSSYSMQVLAKYEIEGLTEKFFHLGDSISNLFVLICGFVGGAMFSYWNQAPYLCFLAAYLLGIGTLLFHTESLNISCPKKNPIWKNFLDFHHLKSLLPLLTVLFLTQFLLQPLIHYWQPHFSEKFTLKPHDPSLIFICYSLGMSRASWCFSKIMNRPLFRSKILVGLLGLVSGFFYFFLSQTEGFVSSIILFSTSMAIFNTTQLSTGILINKALSSANRMMFLKISSLIARLGMIASLWLIKFLMKSNWPINDVYEMYGLLSLTVFFFYFVFLKLLKRNVENYVFDR